MVVTFKESSDRNEIYNVCGEGMKKTNLVITEDSRSVKANCNNKQIIAAEQLFLQEAFILEDSCLRKLLLIQNYTCLKSRFLHFRSRLGGNSPKEVSQKLNFSSFLDHYKSYSVAQGLYNKIVRLL